MTKQSIYPIVLIIIDGWGHSKSSIGNAIQAAYTPTIDALLKTYPATLLNASGTQVGLPNQQVGNSEVGHTCIGSGRILTQDLVTISTSIENKSFFINKTLKDLANGVKVKHTKVHLIGLCSNGGVHSHIDHLLALINFFKKHKILQLCIHFIADGRDTAPYSAKIFLETIINCIQSTKLGSICTLSGRYYGMDRDCRWNRTETFYKTLTQDHNSLISIDPLELINKFYSQNISDEFIIPTRINPGAIENGDGIVFFNFRPDRMRQILQAFAKKNFKGFSKQKIENLLITTFTKYDSTIDIPIVFQHTKNKNCLGEIISKNKLKQLRIAETEKYAHVTYFLNGGVENPFPGEDRELIPSPMVKTYDESPNMSASKITESIINALNQQIYNLIIANYANLDMLGHTGNFKGTIQAIETIDASIAKLIEEVGKNNGVIILTADHGNAEKMIDNNNQPYKSHTTNLVPFILIESEGSKILGHGGKVNLRKSGSLADIAPTILNLLQISKPKEMTGNTLIQKTFYEIRDI